MCLKRKRLNNYLCSITLKTDGDSFSGSTSPAVMGTDEFSGGEVDGNSFEFEMQMNSPMGKFGMTNIGTVYGDNISAEVKTSMGNSAYTGTRA